MPKKTKKGASKATKKAPKNASKVSTTTKRAAVSAPKAQSSFRLRPLGDRVILKEIKDATEQTSSGIFLPASAQDKETKRGEVIAVGPGRYDDGILIPMNVEVGDVVLYNWGDTVTVDGSDYVIARDGEIIAVVRN